MEFSIAFRDQISSARSGLLKTQNSEIKTPVFMPVATQGSVKTIDPEVLYHFTGRHRCCHVVYHATVM